MMTAIPITLVGNNLGIRHKYLNTLVNEAHKKGEEFDVIRNLPEKSPIDRLFKIDLATKIKNVDYIVQNLKDDDMLYVSRALQATWLLETKYEEIINPEYLENRLYPEMITTAVNKMQHWIHLNLTDEMRCEQFFQYYREKNFELAIKFFLKCSKDYIQNEFKHIIYKITPHHLKVLSEKCPHVSNMFFDSITNDDEVKRLYLTNECSYFNTLRHLLKTNPDTVLDVSEKYFNLGIFDRFSAMQTKFIIKYHRNRFWSKPELYTAWLLNTQAVSESLNSEEAKELVLKLARSKYLTYSNWFNHERIEPFIKRLKPEERAAFKNKVFVEVDVGEIEEELLYEDPKRPNEIEYVTIFDDRQPEPCEYNDLKIKPSKRLFWRRRKYPVSRKKVSDENIEKMECCTSDSNVKTLLEKLFDEFRFVSFGKTLYELKKRIAADSFPENRKFMMFVLISKTGGRPDAVALFLELLERHINEPANIRAAVIQSLVERAQLWRLPERSWDQLMKFGQGLGLDGKTHQADCFKGQHAVVIRSLLQNRFCESEIKKTFLANFSTLNDYSLNSSEKKIIATVLPKMLLNLTIEEEDNMYVAVDCIEKLIETLDSYQINLQTYPGLIDTIVMIADKGGSRVDRIIRRLFAAKIARKQLFRFTVKLIINDDSYLNALRHDVTVLDAKQFVNYYGRFIFRANKFFRKLSIYFNEENGMATMFLQELKVKPTKIRGRLLAYLLNGNFLSYLRELNSLDDKDSKLLASVIRANANLARPHLDFNAYDWKKIGAKHVGNKLLKCRAIEIDNNIQELLKWKRTAKLACALSKRTTYQTDVFIKLASIKPTAAIKFGLKLIKLHGDNIDLLIWETIKPIIQGLDVTTPDKKYLIEHLENIDKVPMKIRPDYSTVIYTLLLKVSLYHAMPSLCNLEIVMSNVDDTFLENFVTQFLEDDFAVETLSKDKNDIKCTCMYIRIFIKYLLLCKTEEDQNRKLDKYCKPFLAIMEQLRESDEDKELFKEYFPEMLLTLKYSKVFLNTSYVSPLPVIEKIIVWMRKNFNVAKHFKTFAQLHMLMLFYKATEQAIKLVPNIFSGKKRQGTEGVEVVGKIFGKYIANEVNKLQEQYFESMPELYQHSLVAFLDTFHNYCISSDLVSSIVNGIFEVNKGSAYRLGIYLMEKKRDCLSDEDFHVLINYINKFDHVESQWLASVFN